MESFVTVVFPHMGESSKINQQSKCVLMQLQIGLMNDENNGMGFKVTYLYNDFSYRNSHTHPSL